MTLPPASYGATSAGSASFGAVREVELARILVVDDDPGIRELLGGFLSGHGFDVTTAADGQAMDALLAEKTFDLAVIDLMMPQEDGLSILRRLSAAGTLPVIILSAVGSDVDRIVGLELGAEDYLAKPCNPRELLARIRVVLRRVKQGGINSGAVQAPASITGNRLRFAGWTIDMHSRMLTDPDQVLVPLTDSEFRLLRAFLEHPRRVLSRDQLLDYSAGVGVETYDRAIDVQVSRLRRKLKRGSREDLIRTVRSEGYMFAPAVTALLG